MSDPQAGQILNLPVRGVFALQVREHENTLVVRLVGFHDDDEVLEANAPPLPDVVEVISPPYRRASADARNIR